MDYFSESTALTEHKYLPTIDAHMHVRTLQRAVRQNEVLRVTGLRGMCVQCLTRLNDEFLTNNLIGMLLKILLHGEIYVFGGFYYPGKNEEPRSQDYLSRAKQLYAMGADGIKVYDGKPSVRKKLGMALDCEEFQPMYSFLEENDIPVMNHVGDPANFWDGDDAPEIAKQYGWTYDQSYVHPEKYFEEVSAVFERHPRLKMILAHFFFLSVNMERLENFLNKYPNAYIDITPGTEMYIDFTNEPEKWADFFTRFQDRIIFGTDNGFYGEIPYEINAVRTFLETDKRFNAWEMSIQALNLGEEVCRKILYDNFKALVKNPRLPNWALVREECGIVRKLAEESDRKEDILIDLDDIERVLDQMGV